MTNYGWRCWDIDRAGRLYSPLNFGADLVWPTSPLRARCEAGRRHAAPAADCGCGLRAVPSLPAFLRGIFVAREEFLPKVVGVVALDGHTAGRDRHGDPPGTLRGEVARIVGPVFLGEPFACAAQAVAERYGVDVVVADEPQLEWVSGGLEADVAGYVEAHPGSPAAGLLADAPDAPPNWDEVAPGLWMGGSSETPTAEHFDAVVTLWSGAPAPVGLDAHLPWHVEDTEAPPDAEKLREVVAWTLDQWRRTARVLVRCQIGWNRSGLVVGRVLVESGVAPADALAAIRSARGSAALRNRTFAALVLDVPAPRVFRWGGHGAAGIFFRRTDDSDPRYLLLKRSPGTHQPLKWGLPGGALLPCETPWHGALREAEEEIGTIERFLAEPAGAHVVTEPDGWTYTTFVVDYVPDVRLNGEHTEAAWVTADEAERLSLHPDLETAWPALTGEAR